MSVTNLPHMVSTLHNSDYLYVNTIGYLVGMHCVVPLLGISNLAVNKHNLYVPVHKHGFCPEQNLLFRCAEDCGDLIQRLPELNGSGCIAIGSIPCFFLCLEPLGDIVHDLSGADRSQATIIPETDGRLQRRWSPRTAAGYDIGVDGEEVQFNEILAAA